MLTDKRATYKPFEYPEFYEVAQLQMNEHWVKNDVTGMSSDVHDWNTLLSAKDKHVIGQILKGFTQMEVVVADYWSSQVHQWFPKPEVSAMALTFGAMEVVHADAYDLLNSELGLEDYEAFLHDPVTKNKLDMLIATGESIEEKALSLAIFSAFTEGVLLFSSFAILLSFCTKNRMKALRSIITWSAKDEDLHSRGGNLLFRKLVDENPHIWTDDLKSKIYGAAEVAVELEEAYIEKAFEMGNLSVIQENKEIAFTADIMKNFIKHRTNLKLGDMGLKACWEIDQELLRSMDWFDDMTSSDQAFDFFATRTGSYSKGNDWSKMFRSDKRGSV